MTAAAHLMLFSGADTHKVSALAMRRAKVRSSWRQLVGGVGWKAPRSSLRGVGIAPDSAQGTSPLTHLSLAVRQGAGHSVLLLRRSALGRFIPSRVKCTTLRSALDFILACKLTLCICKLILCICNSTLCICKPILCT